MIYSATNHWVEARDAIWRRCHDVRWCNIVFLASTTKEMHVNISVTVKTVSMISLNDGRKFEESEGNNFFFFFFFFFCRFLCVRIEIDQLLCVTFLVINHSLSANCK